MALYHAGRRHLLARRVVPTQLNTNPAAPHPEGRGLPMIFALNPTIQGDTTIYYIQKNLRRASDHDHRQGWSPLAANWSMPMR